MLQPYPYYVDDSVTMLAVGNTAPDSDSSQVDNCSQMGNNRQLILVALAPIVHGVCHVHVQQIVEDCTRRLRCIRLACCSRIGFGAVEDTLSYRKASIKVAAAMGVASKGSAVTVAVSKVGSCLGSSGSEVDSVV